MTHPLTPQPGDFDHPLHETLVSFVDGRLDAADREWVDSHLVVCAQCGEDVADLRAVQQELATSPVAQPLPTSPVARPLPASPVARPPQALPVARPELPGREDPRWRRRAMAVVAVAAGLIMLVWATLPAPRAPEAEVAVSAPAPPAPAPQVLPEALAPATPAFVTEALASGRVPRSAVHALLRPPVGTLLSDATRAAAFGPMAPVGTAVESARPRFSWTAAPGAVAHTISVVDDRFAEVAGSGPIEGTSWTPASDLPRGVVLSWQVSAETPAGRLTSPAPPRPEARFVILSTSEAREVANARVRWVDNPLALGLRLSQAGLYADAERELTRALSDSRHDAERIKRLLASLRER